MLIVASEQQGNEASKWVKAFIVVQDPLPGVRGEVTNEIRPYVIVPLSYSEDEPLELLTRVASSHSAATGTRWVLTGNAPAALRSRGGADGVQFTGFVSRDEYERLLVNADVAVSLSTDPVAFQCSSAEAVSAGVPVVAADNPAIRDFLGHAGTYFALSEAAFESAVTHALQHRDALRVATYALRERRLAIDRATIRSLKAVLADINQTA